MQQVMANGNASGARYSTKKMPPNVVCRLSYSFQLLIGSCFVVGAFSGVCEKPRGTKRPDSEEIKESETTEELVFTFLRQLVC